MNYAGKFDGAISSDGPGNHSHFVHLNPGHIHAPADAIVVPDAHFLFNADFKRSGVDLVLSSDDHELVLHEYFKGEKHKALASPDGAHLTGELVDALTGHVELAQAGSGTVAASAVIGHITKMQGSATVIRNGVSIILNMGDNVEKGDVVQSGSNSSVGITFIDGTVFGLSSNAKMVLNEMVYDPNGSNNSSLISLVAGTITFVAGETAKRGDMKIDTPVATMGIRGTAVLVEIDFSVPGANGAPNASFQVLVEPDGTTGSYILFDKATMQPLAIVNQAGQQININNGVISQTQNPLTPQMQQLINEVFTQKFTDNSTTKTTSPTGSSTPDGTTYLLKYADAAQQQTTTQGTGNNQQDKPAAPGGPGGPGTQHVPGAPIASFTSVQLFFIERPGLTGSSALDQMKFTVGFSDPNPGDAPTVRADFTGFTLKDAAGHDVPLSPLAQQDVLAAEIDLNPALVAAAGNANNGSTDVLYSLVDKDFDFLAQGQSITLSYVITVNNNYGPAPEVTKQTVTFTIFGTNDVPVIADDKLTQLIEFAAGTSTSGGTLTVLHGEATGGTYDFKDPDLTDTHWIIDANKDPAINHTADPNASDRFNSVHKAALTSASLTLPDGTTLDKAGLEALAPGPMSVFEQALDVNVSTDSTGTGNGEISFQLENLPVFLADFIPAGETLKLYYTIEVTDENGATDTKVVEVDITGTNAAATVWVHTTDDGHDGNWTTGANWGTGNVPTDVNDVIIVTDQLHPDTPAYPATITTGTDATAHSLVMNDFVAAPGESIPPELKLEINSSLTVATDFDLSADSKLTNAGTVTVEGKLELLDDASNPVTTVNKSVITNSGTINLAQGGDIQGLASVTNSGTIELQAGTLNLDIDIADSNGVTGGNINVDSGAKLVLGTDTNPGLVTPAYGGVTSGTVTVKAGGELDLTGGNTLSSGTLTNQSGGQINVSGTGNTLDHEVVFNTGNTSAVDITGALTLQDGTQVTNTDATSGETVDGGSLTLDGATISNGQITNENGSILTLQANGRLDTGLTLTNTAQVDVTGASNVLDDVTVSNTGSASAIDITGALTLQDGATLTNQDGTSGETAESGGTLTMNGATITGGMLTIKGTLDSVGTSFITGATINNFGTIESTGGTLTIDPVQLTLTNSSTGALKADGGELDISGENIANTGTVEALDGSMLKLSSLYVHNLDPVLVHNGTVTTDGTSYLYLTDVSISDGAVNNAGSLYSYGLSSIASSIDNSGSIEVKAGTLTLSGSISDGGSATIDGNATLKLNSIADGQNLNFNGSGAELIIDKSASLSGNISGLVAGDEIDLQGIDYASATGTYINGVLTVTDGNGDSVALNIGTGVSLHFAGSADGTGVNAGTLITLKDTDDAPVVAAGDKVETASVHELAKTTGAPTTTTDPLPAATGTIHFSDVDLTDRMTPSVAQTVTWTAANGTDLTASLTSDQVAALDQALQLSAVSGNNNGSVGWSYSIADSALDFLAIGETVHVNSTVTIDDGEGKSDTAQINVTITGANDVPVITSGAQTGAIAELPQTTGSTTPDTASGTVTFTDPDLSDTHAVTITGVSTSGATSGLLSQATLLSWLTLGTLTDSTNGTTGSNGWSFSAADGNFDYLATGQQVILTYTVQVDDHHGGVVTTPITVTITGSNDVPVITSAAQTGAIAELSHTTGSTTPDTASGTVIFTDPDLSDTHALAITGVSTSGATSGLPSQATLLSWLMLGTPTDSSNGAIGSDGWTFSAQDKNFDYLAVGQTVTLTYTVQVDDHHGGVVTTPVTVTITGANDVPVITGESDPSTQTVILDRSPTVLSAGVSDNALGLPTETFQSDAAGLASNNGTGFGNFTSSGLDAVFTASGHAGIVVGSASGVTAAPFIGPLPGELDPTHYLSIGANSSETITFAHDQNSFGLYWGSIDPTNTISFYDGTTLVATYSGAEIAPLLSSGDQTTFAANGYVEFTDLAPFDKVVLASSTNAFEVDNISSGFIQDSHIHLSGTMSGTLTVSDADVGDTITAEVTGNAVATYDGSTTLPAGLDLSALVDSHAITFDSVTSNGGPEVLQWTYNPTNPDLDFLEPGDSLTLTFNAEVTDGHVTTGNQPLTVTIVGTGASIVHGTNGNDTFVNVSGGVTIFGQGGNDTFQFSPSFGSATIADFDVNHDTINIDHTLFASTQAILASAHSANSGHDTVIADAAHDQITLVGVTVAQIQAHPGDFHLV